MAQHPWLDPNSFFFDGGPLGVLLIHGFTGAPPEMRPMGEYLAAKGYTVSGPRLAGHAITWQQMNRTQPLLIFQGRQDRSVSLKGAPLLYDSVRSSAKELVWLDNSGHCLTVDSEREAVWQKTHEWIQRIVN